MASITIRKLDDEVKTCLRVRAAWNGRSMEEEARLILREAVGRKPGLAKPCKHHPRPVRALGRRGAGSCRRASPRGSRPGSIEAAAMILLDANVVSELMRKSPRP